MSKELKMVLLIFLLIVLFHIPWFYVYVFLNFHWIFYLLGCGVFGLFVGCNAEKIYNFIFKKGK